MGIKVIETNNVTILTTNDFIKNSNLCICGNLINITMKKIYLSLLLMFTAFYVSAQNPTLKTFDFLLGKWEMKTKNGKIVERWQKHKDSLTGQSHKFNANRDSLLTETITLKRIKGDWYFCVTGYEKGNDGKTDFKLVSSAKNTFTFENKQHDFPQQITYQNKGKTELLAWIEGEIGGKKQKMEFPYLRAK